MSRVGYDAKTDAYLSVLRDSGLLLDNKVDLAKGVAEHFCFEISKL